MPIIAPHMMIVRDCAHRPWYLTILQRRVLATKIDYACAYFAMDRVEGVVLNAEAVTGTVSEKKGEADHSASPLCPVT